jgi:hypothetical protein
MPNIYKLTLTIYPVADCGRNLRISDALEVSYEGEDLDALKRVIDWTIINTMKVHNANDGETFVELDIEHNGEYYDHDEQTVWVDLQNNRIKYDIENELLEDLHLEQCEQM